jgi:acetylornithine/N-succinyldiaminopimelate aminotransferase
VVDLLGGGWKVFFANSGAEAIEGAIKLARRWAGEHKPGAYKVVSLERSFHGRTLAALAATGQASKQEAFAPMPEGFIHVPANDIVALSAAVDDSVAAVLLEVVQGEGGVWPLSAEYLTAARSICDSHGCLLIIDEIQTGFFRTGPAFAHQAFGIAPDVITVAKALANGLPIGGIVARDEVASALKPGDHGSTFGGGPAICAAGRATIEALVAEDLGANALEVGAYLQSGLIRLAESTGAITDVRGAGLMVGATLAAPIAPEVGRLALERGIVMNTIGTDILRFLPPLVCGKLEIDTLLSTLSDILGELSLENA